MYDYQRALCEDPDIINAWFDLVLNIRAKYGILDSNTYNFDETGFMMGIGAPKTVVTGADRRGQAKSIQPGNRQWAIGIELVSADRWVGPPMLIVKAKVHLVSWYTEGGLPDDWIVETSLNGWINDKIALAWIEHFDKYTVPRKKGIYRLLILDGHGSHYSTDFERFYTEKKIITLYMPPHSSHLLQPLDVGCFSALKKAYSVEINQFSKARITHIDKTEFFLAFHAAHKRVFKPETIQGGFRGAGLVPFNRKVVLSQLNIKLQTPPSQPGSPALPTPWVSQTPHNSIQAVSQSTLIKDRISHHQGSSPTPILTTIDQLAKGTQSLAHAVSILTQENKTLQDANVALLKRCSAKRTYL
jgi:hypothetical protein